MLVLKITNKQIQIRMRFGMANSINKYLTLKIPPTPYTFSTPNKYKLSFSNQI